MSNLQAKMAGVKFEPARESGPRIPSPWVFVLGVTYPAVVIMIELATRMCAEGILDPMPTLWHTFAIAFVPAGNMLVWMHLRNGVVKSSTWLAFANGCVIAIAGFYALLFLPLLPLAVVGMIFGIGLLPLAPLVSFVSALTLRRSFLRRHKSQPCNRQVFGGLVAGLALLLALDVPAAATRLGVQWASSSVPLERERGLTLLRTLGDDDLLLRLCYETVGRPAGLLSALVMFAGGGLLEPQQRQVAQSSAEVREIYYRAYGVPFNARPAPFEKGRWSRLADFQFDNDHGGTAVGGRLKGLDIVYSRLDGSISGDDAVAYVEWTLEFRNAGPLDREARLQLALPPGGVVSRATLWVNGEEREAAYGGRGEVRAAYQRVAVQQRRDPLLVTTKGADRVLAQAFPVPPNGGTIKFKIAITAPLDITEPSKASLTLPALVDRNFSFAPDMRHSIWIDSRQVLSASASTLAANRIASALFRISGSIGDRDLSRTRQTITVERNPEAARLAARIGDGALIVQEVTPGSLRAPPPALMLVIDGSARLEDMKPQLVAALGAIPPGTHVGAMVATEPLQQVSIAPWSENQRQAVARMLSSIAFVGGQDNAPALAEALQALEAAPRAASKARLLWIHGAQPVSFRGSAARLEQATTRLSRLPDVTLYAVEPGPNELLPDSAWAWGARSLPRTGSPQADLSAFLARTLAPKQGFAITRRQVGETDGLRQGSDHIARLWANDRVLELMRASAAGNREEAVALATQYRLVTPVSGAVVLETKQQYDESRLTPVSQATVPTVPEPHEWALAFVACAGLTWLAWQRRHRLVAGA